MSRRLDRLWLSNKDVQVDEFWSISVCNPKGYLEKNNLTARASPGRFYTIRFWRLREGDAEPRGDYTRLKLYREAVPAGQGDPRPGSTFPQAQADLFDFDEQSHRLSDQLPSRTAVLHGLAREASVPVVAILMPLGGAATLCATMHSAPRPPLHRR
jgi:hypothetical protein